MTNFPQLGDIIDDGYSMRPDMKWPVYGGGQLDRQSYMTSSEASQCPRRIKYRQVSPPVPFTNWGYAERGHIIEAWAVDLIRVGLHPDYSLMFAGDEQVSFTRGNQSGTPDGVLVDQLGQTAMLVEFKSVDPRTNYNNLPKPAHVDQITQNIDLVNTSEFQFKIASGKLIYIDASNLQKRSEMLISFDSSRAEALREKSDMIAAAKSPEDLPATGIHNHGECKLCPFGGKCSGVVEAQKEDADLIRRQERAMKNVFR